jgi:hypothetical protein
MKKINIAYWIITALFSAFMIFSSYGGITLMPEAVAMLHDQLGYPLYFIQFLSVCKVIGAIAILLPMVPARVKEWAYFGFFLDLITGIVLLHQPSVTPIGQLVGHSSIFIAILLCGLLAASQATSTPTIEPTTSCCMYILIGLAVIIAGILVAASLKPNAVPL